MNGKSEEGVVGKVEYYCPKCFADCQKNYCHVHGSVKAIPRTPPEQGEIIVPSKDLCRENPY